MVRFPAKATHYVPVKREDDEEVTDSHNPPPTFLAQPRARHNVLFLLCLIITCVALGGVGGYNVCRLQHASYHDPKAHSIATTAVRTETLSFTYNRTYAEAPSPDTDAAWEQIFPPHGGFFHDAELAPVGGSLAVYHQLHCLDGIRHAYWTLFEAVMKGHNVTFSELDDYSTDWHTRHCLDFLRQMLMCNADLTIEEVDPALGGIRGFGPGREHQCVVWEDVRAWSIRQQEKINTTA